jgi:hypothetical protein
MHIGFWKEIQKSPGRPRRRWEDNIKTDLRATGRSCMDCIYLDQDRGQWQALVNTVMNLGFP